MILLFSLPLAYILFLWLHTEVVEEYGSLLPEKWTPHWLAHHLSMKKRGSPTSLIDHLMAAHDSFFVRLITCPKCLATWLGGITALVLAIPAINAYGALSGLAMVSSLPFLTYLAYKQIK